MPIAAPNSAATARTMTKARSADQHGEQNAGKADDRPDRQIDAARDDHEGHTDGGNAQKRIVGEKIAQHPGREHVGKLQYTYRVR
jgi:hypothetical protein